MAPDGYHVLSNMPYRASHKVRSEQGTAPWCTPLRRSAAPPSSSTPAAPAPQRLAPTASSSLAPARRLAHASRSTLAPRGSAAVLPPGAQLAQELKAAIRAARNIPADRLPDARDDLFCELVQLPTASSIVPLLSGDALAAVLKLGGEALPCVGLLRWRPGDSSSPPWRPQLDTKSRPTHLECPTFFFLIHGFLPCWMGGILCKTCTLTQRIARRTHGCATRQPRSAPPACGPHLLVAAGITVKLLTCWPDLSAPAKTFRRRHRLRPPAHRSTQGGGYAIGRHLCASAAKPGATAPSTSTVSQGPIN